MLRIALPLLALFLAAAIRWLLLATAPSAVVVDPEPVLPLVRVQAAIPETFRLEVVAHGSVTPRTESDLVAEVRGRIVEVSRALVAGGFFDEGEELLQLDGREHAIAVDRARATVKLRASEAELARAEAERRRSLADRDAASASDLQQFESRADVATAALEEARAQLAQAELDLERTTLRAPFEGRVRERHVDVGQFVNPGALLARIYAIDYAEVRLPIQTRELAYLELPTQPNADESPAPGAPVLLRARLGATDYEWPAALSRSEGSIDLKTRMLHVVARVDDPQGRTHPGREPIPAGLFVRATITGRELRDVFRFPPLALRDDANVFVVDSEDRLHVRPVEVLRRGRSEVVIASGVEAGDNVVVSPLRAVTEGMRVRVAPSAVGPPIGDAS